MQTRRRTRVQRKDQMPAGAQCELLLALPPVGATWPVRCYSSTHRRSRSFLIGGCCIRRLDVSWSFTSYAFIYPLYDANDFADKSYIRTNIDWINGIVEYSTDQDFLRTHQTTPPVPWIVPIFVRYLPRIPLPPVLTCFQMNLSKGTLTARVSPLQGKCWRCCSMSLKVCDLCWQYSVSSHDYKC